MPLKNSSSSFLRTTTTSSSFLWLLAATNTTSIRTSSSTTGNSDNNSTKNDDHHDTQQQQLEISPEDLHLLIERATLKKNHQTQTTTVAEGNNESATVTTTPDWKRAITILTKAINHGNVIPSWKTYQLTLETACKINNCEENNNNNNNNNNGSWEAALSCIRSLSNTSESLSNFCRLVLPMLLKQEGKDERETAALKQQGTAEALNFLKIVTDGGGHSHHQLQQHSSSQSNTSNNSSAATVSGSTNHQHTSNIYVDSIGVRKVFEQAHESMMNNNKDNNNSSSFWSTSLSLFPKLWSAGVVDAKSLEALLKIVVAAHHQHSQQQQCDNKNSDNSTSSDGDNTTLWNSALRLVRLHTVALKTPLSPLTVTQTMRFLLSQSSTMNRQTRGMLPHQHQQSCFYQQQQHQLINYQNNKDDFWMTALKLAIHNDSLAMMTGKMTEEKSNNSDNNIVKNDQHRQSSSISNNDHQQTARSIITALALSQSSTFAQRVSAKYCISMIKRRIATTAASSDKTDNNHEDQSREELDSTFFELTNNLLLQQQQARRMNNDNNKNNSNNKHDTRNNFFPLLSPVFGSEWLSLASKIQWNSRSTSPRELALIPAFCKSVLLIRSVFPKLHDECLACLRNGLLKLDFAADLSPKLMQGLDLKSDTENASLNIASSKIILAVSATLAELISKGSRREEALYYSKNKKYADIVQQHQALLQDLANRFFGDEIKNSTFFSSGTTTKNKKTLLYRVCSLPRDDNDQFWKHELLPLFSSAIPGFQTHFFSFSSNNNNNINNTASSSALSRSISPAEILILGMMSFSARRMTTNDDNNAVLTDLEFLMRKFRKSFVGSSKLRSAALAIWCNCSSNNGSPSSSSSSNISSNNDNSDNVTEPALINNDSLDKKILHQIFGLAIEKYRYVVLTTNEKLKHFAPSSVSLPANFVTETIFELFSVAAQCLAPLQNEEAAAASLERKNRFELLVNEILLNDGSKNHGSNNRNNSTNIISKDLESILLGNTNTGHHQSNNNNNSSNNMIKNRNNNNNDVGIIPIKPLERQNIFKTIFHENLPRVAALHKLSEVGQQICGVFGNCRDDDDDDVTTTTTASLIFEEAALRAGELVLAWNCRNNRMNGSNNAIANNNDTAGSHHRHHHEQLYEIMDLVLLTEKRPEIVNILNESPSPLVKMISDAIITSSGKIAADSSSSSSSRSDHLFLSLLSLMIQIPRPRHHQQQQQQASSDLVVSLNNNKVIKYKRVHALRSVVIQSIISRLVTDNNNINNNNNNQEQQQQEGTTTSNNKKKRNFTMIHTLVNDPRHNATTFKNGFVMLFCASFSFILGQELTTPDGGGNSMNPVQQLQQQQQQSLLLASSSSSASSIVPQLLLPRPATKQLLNLFKELNSILPPIKSRNNSNDNIAAATRLSALGAIIEQSLCLDINFNARTFSPHKNSNHHRASTSLITQFYTQWFLYAYSSLLMDSKASSLSSSSSAAAASLLLLSSSSPQPSSSTSSNNKDVNNNNSDGEKTVSSSTSSTPTPPPKTNHRHQKSYVTEFNRMREKILKKDTEVFRDFDLANPRAKLMKSKSDIRVLAFKLMERLGNLPSVTTSSDTLVSAALTMTTNKGAAADSLLLSGQPDAINHKANSDVVVDSYSSTLFFNEVSHVISAATTWTSTFSVLLHYVLHQVNIFDTSSSSDSTNNNSFSSSSSSILTQNHQSESIDNLAKVTFQALLKGGSFLETLVGDIWPQLVMVAEQKEDVASSSLSEENKNSKKATATTTKIAKSKKNSQQSEIQQEASSVDDNADDMIDEGITEKAKNSSSSSSSLTAPVPAANLLSDEQRRLLMARIDRVASKMTTLFRSLSDSLHHHQADDGSSHHHQSSSSTTNNNNNIVKRLIQIATSSSVRQQDSVSRQFKRWSTTTTATANNNNNDNSSRIEVDDDVTKHFNNFRIADDEKLMMSDNNAVIIDVNNSGINSNNQSKTLLLCSLRKSTNPKIVETYQRLSLILDTKSKSQQINQFQQQWNDIIKSSFQTIDRFSTAHRTQQFQTIQVVTVRNKILDELALLADLVYHTNVPVGEISSGGLINNNQRQRSLLSPFQASKILELLGKCATQVYIPPSSPSNNNTNNDSSTNSSSLSSSSSSTSPPAWLSVLKGLEWVASSFPPNTVMESSLRFCINCLTQSARVVECAALCEMFLLDKRNKNTSYYHHRVAPSTATAGLGQISLPSSLSSDLKIPAENPSLSSLGGGAAAAAITIREITRDRFAAIISSVLKALSRVKIVDPDIDKQTEENLIIDTKATLESFLRKNSDSLIGDAVKTIEEYFSNSLSSSSLSTNNNTDDANAETNGRSSSSSSLVETATITVGERLLADGYRGLGAALQRAKAQVAKNNNNNAINTNQASTTTTTSQIDNINNTNGNSNSSLSSSSNNATTKKRPYHQQVKSSYFHGKRDSHLPAPPIVPFKKLPSKLELLEMPYSEFITLFPDPYPRIGKYRDVWTKEAINALVPYADYLERRSRVLVKMPSTIRADRDLKARSTFLQYMSQCNLVWNERFAGRGGDGAEEEEDFCRISPMDIAWLWFRNGGRDKSMFLHLKNQIRSVDRSLELVLENRKVMLEEKLWQLASSSSPLASPHLPSPALASKKSLRLIKNEEQASSLSRDSFYSSSVTIVHDTPPTTAATSSSSSSDVVAEGKAPPTTSSSINSSSSAKMKRSSSASTEAGSTLLSNQYQECKEAIAEINAHLQARDRVKLAPKMTTIDTFPEETMKLIAEILFPDVSTTSDKKDGRYREIYLLMREETQLRLLMTKNKQQADLDRYYLDRGLHEVASTSSSSSLSSEQQQHEHHQQRQENNDNDKVDDGNDEKKEELGIQFSLSGEDSNNTMSTSLMHMPVRDALIKQRKEVKSKLSNVFNEIPELRGTPIYGDLNGYERMFSAIYKHIPNVVARREKVKSDYFCDDLKSPISPPYNNASHREGNNSNNNNNNVNEKLATQKKKFAAEVHPPTNSNNDDKNKPAKPAVVAARHNNNTKADAVPTPAKDNNNNHDDENDSKTLKLAEKVLRLAIRQNQQQKLATSHAATKKNSNNKSKKTTSSGNRKKKSSSSASSSSPPLLHQDENFSSALRSFGQITGGESASWEAVLKSLGKIDVLDEVVSNNNNKGESKRQQQQHSGKANNSSSNNTTTKLERNRMIKSWWKEALKGMSSSK